jgi:hypothetical protein
VVSALLRMPFRSKAAALSTSFKASLARASSRAPAADFFAAALWDAAFLGADFVAVSLFFVVAMLANYLQAALLPSGGARAIMWCLHGSLD